MKFLSRVKDDGFTLVELMVVVAIIGVLSAVAIPNFKKYQAKSKTSEAKLQMSAAYTAMQSWYSDYDNYSSCLNLMGFDPAIERVSRYYAVGWANGINPAANAAAVANGAPAACSAANSVVNDTSTLTASNTNTSGYGAGRIVAGAAVIAGGSLVVANVPAIAAPDATTFNLGALGVIDASKTAVTTADAWTVDQNKRIIQQRTGY